MSASLPSLPPLSKVYFQQSEQGLGSSQGYCTKAPLLLLPLPLLIEHVKICGSPAANKPHHAEQKQSDIPHRQPHLSQVAATPRNTISGEIVLTLHRATVTSFTRGGKGNSFASYRQITAFFNKELPKAQISSAFTWISRIFHKANNFSFSEKLFRSASLIFLIKKNRKCSSFYLHFSIHYQVYSKEVDIWHSDEKGRHEGHRLVDVSLVGVQPTEKRKN